MGKFTNQDKKRQKSRKMQITPKKRTTGLDKTPPPGYHDIVKNNHGKDDEK